MTSKKLSTRTKLQQMLENRVHCMEKAREEKDHSLALIYYGMACGIIDSMRAAGLINWEKASEMQMSLTKKTEDERTEEHGAEKREVRAAAAGPDGGCGEAHGCGGNQADGQ